MKRPQFKELPSASADLGGLTSFSNLGYCDGKWWFATITLPSTFNVYSVDSLTGIASLEHTDTGPYTGTAVLAVILRTWGTTIQACFFLESGSGTASHLSESYSNDSGDNWTDNDIADYGSSSNIKGSTLFKLTNFYTCQLTNSLPTIYGRAAIIRVNTGGGASVADITGLTDDTDGIYAGCVYEGDFYFVAEDYSDGYLHRYSWDGSAGTITDDGSLGILGPSTYDAAAQAYGRRGNTEVLMDNQHLRTRFASGDWVYYSKEGTGNYPSGLIWGIDHLGVWYIEFIIWGNAVWEFTEKGTLKKIQSFEPRDYKKIYLSNINENLAGVHQVQNANGNNLDLTDYYTIVGNVSIISEHLGHKHVIEIDDDDATIHSLTYDTFTPQIIDSIEVFLGSSTTGLYRFEMNVGVAGTYPERVTISFYNGIIYYRGATYVAIGTYTVSEKIHIRIDYSCTTDTCSVWIDGSEVLTDVAFFDSRTATTIDYISFETYATMNGYKAYVDSLGLVSEGYVNGSNKAFNAYVGYGSKVGEAWFSTGAFGSILQLDWIDYTVGTVKALTKRTMYEAPKCSLIRTTPPAEDEWLKLFTDLGKLFYGGRVESTKNDNRFYWKYTMKSWEDEYKDTKITVALNSYTYKQMWEYILDNYSNYIRYGRGTNASVNEFTADQIDGTDTDWTNADGTGCVSSLVEKKAFLNNFLYNVLQQYDNGAGACSVSVSLTGSLIFSIEMASSDPTKIQSLEFYESATRIGYILIDDDKISWYDGSIQNIVEIDANTIYHIAVSFNISTDTVDIYIDGVFESNESLENNITAVIDGAKFLTDATDLGYYGYWSQLYIGGSLVDAMHTYSSISPLLTTVYDFNIKSQTIPSLQKTTAEETGYVVSVRPDGLMYIDQYGESGITINATPTDPDDHSFTFQNLMSDKKEKYSRITFYGGFVAGVQLFKTGYAEPNFGSYEAWFPLIVDQSRLDTMVALALINRNIEIKKQTVGKRGVGPLDPGTSIIYNNAHYEITMAVWNIWRTVLYDGLLDDNRPEIADSFLTLTGNESSPDPVVNAVNTNITNISNIEQNVGVIAEDVSDPTDGSGINPKSIKIGTSGATLIGILDEDDMNSDSAVHGSTQQSIKAYVDTYVQDSVIIMPSGYTQTTLEAAITALPANGGTIILPEGTCTFTSTMTVTKPIHFIGNKIGTIWDMSTATSTTYIVEFTSTYNIVEGVRFMQTGASGSGVYFNSSLNTIRDCIVQSLATAGIGIKFADAKNANVADCNYIIKFHLGIDCQSDYSKIVNNWANDSNYGFVLENCNYSICSQNSAISSNTADVYGYTISYCALNNNICPLEFRLWSATDCIFDGNVYNVLNENSNTSCTTGSNELY